MSLPFSMSISDNHQLALIAPAGLHALTSVVIAIENMSQRIKSQLIIPWNAMLAQSQEDVGKKFKNLPTRMVENNSSQIEVGRVWKDKVRWMIWWSKDLQNQSIIRNYAARLKESKECNSSNQSLNWCKIVAAVAQRNHSKTLMARQSHANIKLLFAG